MVVDGTGRNFESDLHRFRARPINTATVRKGATWFPVSLLFLPRISPRPACRPCGLWLLWSSQQRSLLPPTPNLLELPALPLWVQALRPLTILTGFKQSLNVAPQHSTLTTTIRYRRPHALSLKPDLRP